MNRSAFHWHVLCVQSADDFSERSLRMAEVNRDQSNLEEEEEESNKGEERDACCKSSCLLLDVLNTRTLHSEWKCWAGRLHWQQCDRGRGRHQDQYIHASFGTSYPHADQQLSRSIVSCVSIDYVDRVLIFQDQKDRSSPLQSQESTTSRSVVCSTVRALHGCITCSRFKPQSWGAAL